MDKRSDLWALRVVLLEMLTGRQVFTGETVSHVMAAVLKTDPDWTALPSDTPATIRRLLRRCLEKDRKRRLADASDAAGSRRSARTPSCGDDFFSCSGQEVVVRPAMGALWSDRDRRRRAACARNDGA